MALNIIKSCLKTWLPILKTVTVEPAALLLMTSTLMSYLVLQDLLLERVCKVDLNYDTETCNSIVKSHGNYSKEEGEVQKVAAQIRTYTSIVAHSIPLIFILFMGPWSDIYGRKYPMFLGAFSFFVNNLCLLISSYFENMDALSVSLISTLLKSILGGNVAFSMAAYSYIADSTDISVRTVRTGMLSAGYTLGVPFGFALGGAVRKAGIGYMVSFAISGVISLVGCVIVILGVDNKIKGKSDLSPATCSISKSGTKDDSGFHEKKSTKTWWTVLDLWSVLDVISVPFKKRWNSDRLYIWMLLITWMCVAAPINGEFGVMYLYLRNRLHWDAGDYGYFSMYNFFIGVAGTIMSMGLLKHLLKLSDPMVGFIAGISQFSGCIIYAFATTATLMYIAPTVDLMNGTMIVIARSMISKIVSPDEMGKTFALIAILETLVPLVMDPTYSTLYRLTVDIFSGSFFILSAVLTIPPQLIYAWFIWESRPKSKQRSYDVTEDFEKGSETGGEDKGVLNLGFSAVSLEEEEVIDPKNLEL